METDDEEEKAFSDFLSSYSAYKETMVIDSLREEEYSHLEDKNQVCLDYTGVGLFSNSQKRHSSSVIGLSFISLNLATHAMYPDDGGIESAFRKRILHYLNLDEDDYYLVFTANSFSAFKLLGESYPFHESPNLLLAYDHRCDDIDALRECAAAKSGIINSVSLTFPQFKIDTHDLHKKLESGRRKANANNHKMSSKSSTDANTNKGLLAYPYSSRVTGCRNSSRWIQKAQTDGWHVLLDVTNMDAKMLSSLGLSLFLPDFVICSFYNVFGQDPAGMGCLAIKKSVLRTLGDSSRARAIGMVKIVKKEGLGYCVDSTMDDREKEEIETLNREFGHRRHESNPLDGFSLQQPEWSTDLVSIDKSLFYRSECESTASSKEYVREDRENESMHGGPSNVKSDDEDSHAYGMQMKALSGRLISTTKSGHVKSTRNDRSGWMAWDLSREYRNYETFYQANSWRRENWVMNEDVGPSSQPDKMDALSSDERMKKWEAYEGVLSRRSVKDLFYLDQDAPRQDPDYSSSSSKKLFLKHQGTKSKTGKQIDKTERMIENEWKVFYARKARFRDLASSSSISSFSVPSGGPKPSDNEICCKGMNQADMLGYRRIAIRLRSLASWLISSLSMLQHPEQEHRKLVKIYSQVSLLDRGSTVAFSLFDSMGNKLDPQRVQLLADRDNISLRVGVIEGTFTNNHLGNDNSKPYEDFLSSCMELPGYKRRSRGDSLETICVPVVYVSLGFLNNFSDVYKLWSFISKFLDPNFVNKELWHYQALNQETIEI